MGNLAQRPSWHAPRAHAHCPRKEIFVNFLNTRAKNAAKSSEVVRGVSSFNIQGRSRQEISRQIFHTFCNQVQRAPKGGRQQRSRPLTFCFWSIFANPLPHSRSLFGNPCLVFGYLRACPLLRHSDIRQDTTAFLCDILGVGGQRIITSQCAFFEGPFFNITGVPENIQLSIRLTWEPVGHLQPGVSRALRARNPEKSEKSLWDPRESGKSLE